VTFKKRLSVYTLTPNPALDLSGHVSSLVPNEKNYVFAERRDPGGNGINSARIIHRMGEVPVYALGFIGGTTGREIEGLLSDEGVTMRFTKIRGNNRTNVTANNDADHRQTRLTFPGPKIERDECIHLLERISSLKAPGIFTVSGSLPEGLPKDFHRELAETAMDHGLGVIADVPAKLIGSLTKLRSTLLMIKPNLPELEEWAGKKLRSDKAIIEAARKLLDRPDHRGLAALVVVSLAERGALLLCGDQVWMGHAPNIRARGTVGAGDSMVGAMASRLALAELVTPADIWAVEDFSPLTDALAWGLAAGAATAESAGTSLARASEIRRLRKKIRIQSLAV
jgi:6-phosphofructokinase 2